MKLQKLAGATSEIWQIFIADSSSTTGAGLTGLVFNTAGLTAYYHRDTDTTATVMTLVTMTVGTFTSLGFKEIDATNMPGWYQLCPPNAALASGAKSCGFLLKGATNMAPLPIEVQLTAVNPDSATAFITSVATVTTVTNQLTAAQIATGVWQDTTPGDFTTASSIGKSLYTTGNAPGAASGLALVGSNMGTVSSVTGSVGSVTGAVGSVTGAVGSVTGNVGGNVVGSVASVTARVTANTDQLAGQTVTAAAGVTFPSSVASPTNITAGTITTVTNLTNAPTAGDFTATMKTSIGTAVAASAVASVTGNVGGNVTGSVGSVVGAVGSVTAAVSVTGDFSATMKTSIGTAVAASAVASVTGNVGGNVVGSVGSVTAGVALTSSERASVADAILDRDMSLGTDSGSSSVRTPRQALRALRNKNSATAGVVYKEDDTTTSWSYTVTTDAAADPITVLDPA